MTSSDSAEKKSSDSYVQSFARGLAVVKAFNAEHPAQTLTEVAQASGLTRAGARRILLTLQTLGYVRSDGRLFRLTPKILDLGFSYLTSMPLWNLAEPFMEALVQEVQESCSASVLDGDDIVYVLRVPVRKVMSINLSIGSRLPAWCTSMGRVMLAALSDRELDEAVGRADLHHYTAKTVRDREQLKSSVMKARQQGWALVDQELEEGLISLAVPIRNRAGHVVAAMNISGQANRTSPAQMEKSFLEPLRRTADRISSLVV
ncbi:IclR family transcriptional regulator [Pandoraea terrae]|uniref:IclR family transcriptional regulator n=1 Tax=Pandoraea terrae TaxID=1537710 RepID=A0A5E4WN73_9BURK|nr:IclR family transcriptional regulator [Pandoraea terrae]VVE24465.1 IclR family transcriptional regulator [Pandoraea terrae]